MTSYIIVKEGRETSTSLSVFKFLNSTGATIKLIFLPLLSRSLHPVLHVNEYVYKCLLYADILACPHAAQMVSRQESLWVFPWVEFFWLENYSHLHSLSQPCMYMHIAAYVYIWVLCLYVLALSSGCQLVSCMPSLWGCLPIGLQGQPTVPWPLIEKWSPWLALWALAATSPLPWTVTCVCLWDFVCLWVNSSLSCTNGSRCCATVCTVVLWLAVAYIDYTFHCI